MILTLATGVFGLVFVLVPGFGLVLLSALTAWLWTWRAPVGVVAWVCLLLLQLAVAKDLFFTANARAVKHRPTRDDAMTTHRPMALPVPTGDGWWSLVPIWEPTQTPTPLRRWEPAVPYWATDSHPEP